MPHRASKRNPLVIGVFLTESCTSTSPTTASQEMWLPCLTAAACSCCYEFGAVDFMHGALIRTFCMVLNSDITSIRCAW
jgi:hypothetical protein